MVLENDSVEGDEEISVKNIPNSDDLKRSTIFERWTEKFKEFLDKA